MKRDSGASQEDNLPFEAEERIRKQVVALLLGGVDRPIKTKVNFQKELFLLVQSFPKFNSLFNFMPHKLGPYSNEAEDVIENYPDLFDSTGAELQLTDEGRRFYNSSLNQMVPHNRKVLRNVVDNIREHYDRLNDQEFMFLVYMTFGYTEKSEVFDKLMENKEKLAKALLRKGVNNSQEISRINR